MRRYILALSLLFAACSSDAGFEPLTLPISTESVARGRSLFHGLAACSFCHGEKADSNSVPSGGRAFFDLYGEVKASNLTPSKSGLGSWQVRDFVKAIRKRESKDGRQLSAQVHRGMEWISDQDLLSILAYLRTAPPVENEIPTREVDFMDRNTTGFFEGSRTVQGFVPAIDPRNKAEYGRYLVDHVARCQSCHNSPGSLLNTEGYLEGGALIKLDVGEKTAPGITNSNTFGIGAWSEDQIVSYLRTGRSPDQRLVDPNFCPVGFYKLAEEEDLMAIAAYLKSDTESR